MNDRDRLPLGRASKATRRRYDRLAGVYDRMVAGAERAAFGRWRRELWSGVEGRDILEVGIGTGRNIPYYPQGVHVVGVDLSRRMLEHAQVVAVQAGADVELREMDVERLDFPDASFDAALATFVFSAVPSPIQGLREIRRVPRPGGRLHLLEHVLSAAAGLREVMHLLNPAFLVLVGTNIDRTTGVSLVAAGFRMEAEQDLWLDIVKLFRARAAWDARGADKGCVVGSSPRP